MSNAERRRWSTGGRSSSPRAAARSTPGDSAGNEILFAAYRSKIDFLAEAVHRGGSEEMFHEGVTP